MGNGVFFNAYYLACRVVAGEDQREGADTRAKHSHCLAGFDHGRDPCPLMGGTHRKIDLGQIEVEVHPVFPVQGGQSLLACNDRQRQGAVFAAVLAIAFSHHPDGLVQGQDGCANLPFQCFQFQRHNDHSNIADPVETAW